MYIDAFSRSIDPLLYLLQNSDEVVGKAGGGTTGMHISKLQHTVYMCVCLFVLKMKEIF